ncbi:hypothetical protein FB03_05250 [Actinotignum schaalii]|nr:hypothetical protein FB03_05250 [Actinotignum schaalii]
MPAGLNYLVALCAQAPAFPGPAGRLGGWAGEEGSLAGRAPRERRKLLALLRGLLGYHDGSFSF